MKTVLVTGATSGLGKALAYELAGQSCRVLIHCRDAQKGQNIVNALKVRFPYSDILLFYSNYENIEEVKNMCSEIISQVNRIDVIINNVGSFGTNEKEMTQDRFEKIVQVNFIAHYYLVKGLLVLLANKVDRTMIINISSSAQRPFSRDILSNSWSQKKAYEVSKFMMNTMTYFLCGYFKRINSTILCVHPGSIMPTNMTKGMQPVDSLSFGVNNVLRLLEIDHESTNGKFFYKNTLGLAIDETYMKASYLKILNYIKEPVHDNCI